MCETPPRRPNPREPGRPSRFEDDDPRVSTAARFIDEALSGPEGFWTRNCGETEVVTQQSLRVLTWNSWYSEFECHRRWAYLLSEAVSLRPEVVALQEVTDVLRRILAESHAIRDTYAISPSKLGGFCEYDVVLLVRRDLIVKCWWSIDDLPSDMGRRCLGVDLEVAGATVRIANMHLESSKPNASVRRAQLEQIVQCFAAMDSCFTLLVGDMNLCSTWVTENSFLEQHFVDIWPLLHGFNEPGFTEDTELNLMRLQIHEKSKQVRFDRILVAKTKEVDHWRARSIDLVGVHEICKANNSLGGGSISVFPSDHFGVMCTFERVEAEPSQFDGVQ